MAEWVDTVLASFREHVRAATELLSSQPGEPSGIQSNSFITQDLKKRGGHIETGGRGKDKKGARLPIAVENPEGYLNH